MATTDLTASEIRGFITDLQRAIGTDRSVTVVNLSDGARTEWQPKTDAEKYRAIGYFESLLEQVTSSGAVRTRRLLLASTSGIEC